MERVDVTGILSRGINQNIQSVPIHNKREAYLDPVPEEKSGKSYLVGVESNLKQILMMSTKIIFKIQRHHRDSLVRAMIPPC